MRALAAMVVLGLFIVGFAVAAGVGTVWIVLFALLWLAVFVPLWRGVRGTRTDWR